MNLQSNAGMKGTPAYMAPEYLAKEEISPAIDVYAYGIIVYEIMTWEMPFARFSFMELLKKICYEGYRPKPTDDTPEAYKNLISNCWSQNPEERPTFEKIVQDIDDNESNFITELVNENDFYDYKDYINNYHSTFDIKNSLHFEDFMNKKYAKERRRSTLRRTTVRVPPQLDVQNTERIEKSDPPKEMKEKKKRQSIHKIIEEDEDLPQNFFEDV